MKISLGTAQFGLNYGIANYQGKINEKEAGKILSYAKDIGINFIDTASSYGDSEKCIGSYPSNSFEIITKLNAVPENIKDTNNWINVEFNSSLKRLNKKKVYGILLHRPEQLTSCKGEDIFNSLIELKKRNLVEKIGISIYSPDELDIYDHVLDFDIVQCPLNIIDNRLINSGWLKKLKKNNIEVHTRSSFLQGLLLLNEEELPKNFLKWNNIWRKWNEWLLATKVSPVEACISYAMSFNEIDRVIIGVDGINHLKEIYKYYPYNRISSFPDISSNDINLIDPSKWEQI